MSEDGTKRRRRHRRETARRAAKISIPTEVLDVVASLSRGYDDGMTRTARPKLHILKLQT